MSQVAPFFSEMEKFISDSRIAVAAGKEFELAGLDERIEKLCTMIMDLSQEERMMYEDRLQDLLSNLNALGLEMKDQVEGVKNIPQHRNANVAYRTADSRDNFGKRDEDKK